MKCARVDDGNQVFTTPDCCVCKCRETCEANNEILRLKEELKTVTRIRDELWESRHG